MRSEPRHLGDISQEAFIFLGAGAAVLLQMPRALWPAPLRAAFGLPWSAADQRRWDRFVRYAPTVYWHIPAFLRHLPARWVLRDMRRRLAAGRHLI